MLITAGQAVQRDSLMLTNERSDDNANQSVPTTAQCCADQ